MAIVLLILVVVALVFGAVGVIRSDARDLTAWGVVLISVVLLIGQLRPLD